MKFRRLNRNLKKSESFEQGPPTFFENQLMTYAQAARYLGLSVSYVKELKGTNQIPWVSTGGRSVRFRRSSLDRWIEEREIK